MKKAKSDLLMFIIGLAMLAVGFYIFSAKVTVTTGFGFHFGRVNINGGVVVVPMLAGVFWWFIIKLGELLLDTLSQAHSSSRSRILGNEHDSRVLALAETVVDKLS